MKSRKVKKQKNKRSLRTPQRKVRLQKKAVKKQIKKQKKTRKKGNKQMSTNIPTKIRQLPIPLHFDPKQVGSVRRVDYAGIEEAALSWRKRQGIRLASLDDLIISLLIVDAQNTFCIPGFELYVGGRSGDGAIMDNTRLAQFIYRYLEIITRIIPTMDTHTAMQIFHRVFFVNAKGEHPRPIIDKVDLATLKSGEWQVNPEIAWSLSDDKSPAGVAKRYLALKEHAIHYCETLEGSSKLPLTIWPYHAELGGIGHALVAAIEEACWFHNHARASQTEFAIKGGNPLSENYSILRPEVLTGARNHVIGYKNAKLIRTLHTSDRVIIAGQAKSHCVAWTVADLLTDINTVDPELAKKVYLLVDCTSPVAVPNPKGGFFVDYTDEADAAFERFAKAGMHLVKSTDPVESWPGFIA